MSLQHISISSNRLEITLLLRQLAHEGRAVVMATHELDLALQTADEVWLAGSGQGMLTGAPEDLVLRGSFDEIFASRALTCGRARFFTNLKDHYPSLLRATSRPRFGRGMLWSDADTPSMQMPHKNASRLSKCTMANRPGCWMEFTHSPALSHCSLLSKDCRLSISLLATGWIYAKIFRRPLTRLIRRIEKGKSFCKNGGSLPCLLDKNFSSSLIS
ncbi:MAG: hypothetical protein QM762_23980 [Chryseolinea sp.]